LQPSSIKPLQQRWNRAVASVVSATRRDADLTQLQLAAAMRIHRNTVARIEAGKRSMTVREFMLFAHVLKIPPAELFDRVLRWKGVNAMRGIEPA